MTMTSRVLFVALMAALAPGLALAAGTHAGGHAEEATVYGEPGNESEVNRVIEVEANGMRYKPAVITVRRGETIRFVVKGTDSMAHEFVLGDAKSLKEHAELMRRHPDMEHEDPNMAKLAAGGTGSVIWKFTRVGTVEFACLIPGHYEAGMKGRIRVTAR